MLDMYVYKNIDMLTFINRYNMTNSIKSKLLALATFAVLTLGVAAQSFAGPGW
jgi:hypothetical protein